MTPTGCSIASAATVSTIGATGCFAFRAAFFTGVRLGLALATVFACAALDALRGLPRLAELPLRSLARFCTFDPLLRLAMIDPLAWLVVRKALMRITESGNPANDLSTGRTRSVR